MPAARTSQMPLARLLFYALPAIPIAAMTLPLYIIVPTFYSETLGLSLAAVGAALLAVRIMDAVSDPVIGWLSDRWRPAVRAPARLLPDGPAGRSRLLRHAVLAAGKAWRALPRLLGRGIVDGLHRHAALLHGLGRRARRQLSRALAHRRLPRGLHAGRHADRDRAAICDRHRGRRPARAWRHSASPSPPACSCSAGLPSPTCRSRRNIRCRMCGFSRACATWRITGRSCGCSPPISSTASPTASRRRCSSISFRKSSARPDMRGPLLFTYFLAGLIGVPFAIKLAGRIGKHRAWCYAMLVNSALFALVPLLGQGRRHLVCGDLLRHGADRRRRPRAAVGDPGRRHRRRHGALRRAALRAFTSRPGACRPNCRWRSASASSSRCSGCSASIRRPARSTAPPRWPR